MPTLNSIEFRQEHIQTVADIQQAIEDDRLTLNCQRMVAHSDNRSNLRLEILLRLVDTQGKIVGPTEFLPALEHFNLTGRIDTWVVARTLAWLSQHTEQLNRIERCSINLSSSSLADSEFLEFLNRRFDSAKELAKKVSFEIKVCSNERPDDRRRFIKKLREKGCQFILDNVGSGWGEIDCLRTLPIGTIKIDGQLINNILEDEIDYLIVKSIAEVGHAMGKRIVASQVESRQVYDALRGLGIDYVQGNYVAEPEPLAELQVA